MVDAMKLLLEEARDLLLERRQGSPARSAAHNARLVIEDAIKLAASPPAREEAPGEWAGCKADDLTALVSDETMRALLSCKDVGSGRAHLASILNALRARTSEPAREAVAWGTKDGIPDGETVEVRETDGSVSRMIVGSIHWRTMLQDLGSNVAVRRFTHPAPASADKLRVAKEALERIADEVPERSGFCQSDVDYGPKLSDLEMQREARQALATLNEEGS